VDPDTDDGQLLYEITAEPKHGFLESKLKPGSSITTFTQGTENLTLWPLFLFFSGRFNEVVTAEVSHTAFFD